ncbi:MAG: ketopantoate reductase family protein [Candidatus Sericytochromatia bacterium]|nr:ketopantoate reductase family protein [Candidatus Sericytochromatia bacterium]
MSFPSVVVIGAGSIGTFLAARCSTVTETLLVARDATAGRFAEGITLVGAFAGLYRVPCVGWSQVARFPDHCLILVTPKIFQLQDVLSELAAHWRPGMQPVLCQNGLGVVAEADRWLPGPDWARAIAWFGIRFEPPTTAHVTGVKSMEMAGGDPVAMADAAELLAAIGVPPVFVPDVPTVEWRKALWNVTLNGLCALAEAPNGAGDSDPLLRPLAETLLAEAAAVARAEGVDVTAEDEARVFEGARVTATNLNSTLQDLWAGRPTEMPWLNGAVVERATRLGVSVPSHRLVCSLVNYLERTGSRKRT